MKKGSGKCYIIGAGEETKLSFTPGKEDFVIACDGGYDYCKRQGIQADLVVGDFDSLLEEPEHRNVIRLKPEKDDTDTGFAVKEGQKRGYQEFLIYGGTGGRSSHTIANIQLLSSLAQKGCRGTLVGPESFYQVIQDGEVCFPKEQTGYLSVFCLGDRAEGVCETGLKYSLSDAVLTKEFPIGVSNEFTGKESRISVRKGQLLLIGEGF